jgi:hypothetical protein
MLRIRFLPSDFNPMVLMLGEAEDFRALAGVLRYFSRDPIDTRIDRLAFCRPGGTALTMALAHGPSGVARHPADPDAWLWRLDPDRAAGFADLVESLSAPDRLAGSEMLECGLDDEIPVKISRGEYTEDFLTQAR